MGFEGFYLILGIMIVVVIVVGIIGAMYERRRRETLSQWASENGLRFDASRYRDLEQRFPDFHPLHQGSNRYAYNVISGDWRGREVLAFDYHYETYSSSRKGGRRTNHHYFSAVIVRTKFPVQPLVIRSRSFFDSIASFFGFEDISFESAEFNKAFTVKAPNRRWAFDVLHTRAMQFLLDKPRFSIEFDHHHGIAWRDRRFQPHEFEHAVTVIEGLLDQLPDYVRQQQIDGEAAVAH